jgi:hypothetical protein
MAASLPSPPDFLPSRRRFWFPGPFFSFPDGHLSCLAVFWLPGRPSFFLKRHLRNPAARITIRAVIFVPERLSFFRKPYLSSRSLILASEAVVFARLAGGKHFSAYPGLYDSLP